MRTYFINCIFLLLLVLFAFSCMTSNSNIPDDGMVHGLGGSSSGYQVTPLGMVFVPPGIGIIGQGDESNKTFSLNMRQRTVTLEGFWMDATEVTNNQYRQFVGWVTDSIVAKLLGFVTTGEASGTGASNVEYIDWKAFRSKGNQQLNSEEGASKLTSIVQPKGSLPSKLAARLFVINPKKILYKYEQFNLKEASKSANRNKPLKTFVVRNNIPIYPDTLVWMKDFTYSYNEPFTKKYWGDQAYGNYPVVGVNWSQASAYCFWRTELMNQYLVKKGNNEKLDYYRLPSEYEWEYAARGGRMGVVYPWGNYYLRNKKGCLLANFKPRRGDYAEDGAAMTARVDSYWPNDFGLYNMSGNVAEWTSSIYYEGASTLMNDLNPTLEYNATKKDLIAMKRKVIRGGSWKDVGSLLQLGQKYFEYQDSAKSYIGFRTVISLPPIR